MNEEMNAYCVHECQTDPSNEGLKERMKTEWTNNKRINKQMIGQTNEQMNGRSNEWTNGRGNELNK